MSLHETYGQPLLTFPDADKSPLSIRAKALVFVDPRSRQLREDLESLAPRALTMQEKALSASDSPAFLSGSAPLEGMGVQVRHARQQRA